MTSPATTPLQRAGDGLRTVIGVGGLVAVVLGLLILFFPAKSGAITMQIVAAVMAAYALVVGVVYVGSAVFTRTLGGWARTGHILLGVLYLIGGGIMMTNLGAAGAVIAVFLTVTIGVLWVFEGIMALSVSSQGGNRTWTIIYGVVSLIAGFTLMFSPLISAVTLWLLLGVSMVVMGVVQMIRAFGLKPKA